MTNQNTYHPNTAMQTSSLTNQISSGCSSGAVLLVDSKRSLCRLKQSEFLRKLLNLNHQLDKKFMDLNLNKRNIGKRSLMMAKWIAEKMDRIIKASTKEAVGNNYIHSINKI